VYNLYAKPDDDLSILAQKSFTATGYKQRVYLTWYENSAAQRHLYLTRSAYADTSVFYTDGWQCEIKDHPTTYCDGDMVGLVIGQTDYGWYGLPHTSASWRSARTASGGEVIKLRDLGFTLMAIIGLGMAPVNNIGLASSSGGGFYQDTILNERQFTLIGSIQGYSLPDLQRVRRDLINALKPDRVYPKQPLLLQYQMLDDCGNEASEVLNIPCNYQDGLPGQVDNNFQERLGLQFQMFLPLVRGEGEEGATLGYQSSIDDADYVIMRTKDGVWQKVVAGASDNVNVITIGPDGNVYAGGDFSPYIYVYNPLTGSLVTLDGGMDDRVYAMAFDATGNLYVGGHFANAGPVAAANIAMWDGSAWHALGAGVDDSVHAIAIGKDGMVYAGGEFHNAGGAAAAHIAYWDPSASTWSTMDVGANNYITSLAFGPGDKLYVGGGMTTVGGAALTVNYIAMWDGTTWYSMNGGASGVIYSIAVGPDGSVYVGGIFNTIGSPAIDAYSIAKWNQVYWSSLAGGAPGAYIECLKFDQNNFLLASGYIYVIGGVPVISNSAIWNGSSWSSVDIELPSAPIDRIYTAIYDSAGNLYIGTGSAGTAIASIATTITNHGSAAARPKVVFTGPGTVYQLRNIIPGQIINFNNLKLLAGETATLDLDKNTFISTFRGDLRSTILPGSAEEFILQPGENLISLFIGGTTDANTAAIIRWTDQYQGIDEAVR